MSGNVPWVSPVDSITAATPLLAKSSNLNITYDWYDMFYGYIPGSI